MNENLVEKNNESNEKNNESNEKNNESNEKSSDSQQIVHPAENGICFDSIDSSIQIIDSFDEMGLKRNLLRGIYSFGFDRPSAIQQRAIVPLSNGLDLIAQAPSGTGKTGAFSIGLLQRIDTNDKTTQGLILSPTRELATQTCGVIESLGKFMTTTTETDQQKLVHCFIGGTNVRSDLQTIASGIQIAVGTPGRVMDLITRGALRVENLKMIVIDEADEMLSRGFEDQIRELFRFISNDVQVSLFSATLPPPIVAMASQFMKSPLSILVRKEQLTLEGIRQFYIAVEEKYKLETLLDIYRTACVAQSVVFCNNKRKVDWLSKNMEEKGHSVSLIHSDLSKDERSKMMERFKAGTSRIMIATDLFARGIDIQHVSIVVNFDFPKDRENYLHRIGRGGRYGRKGIAINFVTPEEAKSLDDLCAFYATKIEELPLNFAEYISSSNS